MGLFFGLGLKIKDMNINSVICQALVQTSEQYLLFPCIVNPATWC